MASISRRRWTTRSGEARTGWEVTWTDGRGKRRRKLFTGAGAQKAAKHHRSLIELAPASGADAGDRTAAATVRDGCDAWIAAVKARRRERGTIEKYEQHRDNHIGAVAITRDGSAEPVVFGEILLGDLTSPDCEAFKAALLARLSVPMAQKVMTSLRMMLAQAVRTGAIAANPARETRIAESKRGRRRVQIPEKDVIRSLIAAAATEPPAPPTFAEVWVMLGIFAGLRPSELRGAAVEDLEMRGRSTGIQVRRRADEWGMLGPTKTDNGERFVPLGPVLVALLRRWLLVVPKSAALPDPARPGETIHLLLPTSIGTVQTLGNVVNRVWLPLSEAAGLVRRSRSRTGEATVRPRYPVNCLRHIHASLLIDQGLSEKQLTMRMGHSSIKVTLDIYGHLFDQRDVSREVARALESDLVG